MSGSDTHVGFVSLLPVAHLVLTILTIGASYVTSTELKHVPRFLPTVSTTHLRQPESAIFAWGMTMCAVLMALLVAIKFLQLKEYMAHVPEQNSRPLFKSLNRAALGTGLAAAVVLTCVACFPADVAPVFHDVVLLAYLVAVSAYQILVTRLLLYQNSISYASKCFRVILCAAAPSLFVAGLALRVVHEQLGGGSSMLQAAAVCDYVFVLVVCLFFMSYFFDFRLIRFVCFVEPKRQRWPSRHSAEQMRSLLVGDT
eukprot:TRINITY_DN25305_c0_g1_i1.p1 TRINITY_DN25305_c0_g1~~TRINITY_DN25305_c0_g1_i1.p1  ORF type:complete len:256 (-),score=58.92 TRINITY_DN25305_c0_g1_i1:98-865(-)